MKGERYYQYEVQPGYFFFDGRTYVIPHGWLLTRSPVKKMKTFSRYKHILKQDAEKDPLKHLTAGMIQVKKHRLRKFTKFKCPGRDPAQKPLKIWAI